MASEKVTPMVVKVDLQCPTCKKKIKKTLYKIPEVRDQIYDEKNNLVKISVITCCPEIVRDKLLTKAGKVIRDIEIVELKKAEKKESMPVVEGKKVGKKESAPEKPKLEKKELVPANKKELGEEKKEPAPEKSKPKPNEGGKTEKVKEKAESGKPKESMKALEVAAPVSGVPSVFPYMGPMYDGGYGGAHFHGYGFPPPLPQPVYEGHIGPQMDFGPGPNTYGYYRPVYNEYGYGYGPMSRSERYDSEETPAPAGCSVM